MELPGGSEVLICLLIALVVFGSKRLPDSARALGKSLRILKEETRGLHDQDGSDPEFASRAVPAGIRSDPLGPALPVCRFDPYTGERLESAGPP